MSREDRICTVEMRKIAKNSLKVELTADLAKKGWIRRKPKPKIKIHHLGVFIAIMLIFKNI